MIRKKDIFALVKGPTQGIDYTTLTAKAQYSINFSRSNRKFHLSLHYDGSNSFLFVNATKIYQFKANDSKCPLWLGNISKDFPSINMKNTELNGYVYKFSVDYNIIDTSYITDIHIYLIKKNMA